MRKAKKKFKRIVGERKLDFLPDIKTLYTGIRNVIDIGIEWKTKK